MADRIAVLNEGKIVQIGTPDDIYDRPGNMFVAGLVGTPGINLLNSSRENGSLHVEDSPVKLAVDYPTDKLPAQFVLGVRPEDVNPDPNGDFEGEVALIEPLGVETILHIKTGEQTLLSLIGGLTDLRIGDQVRFNIVRERLHYFREDGTRVAV